MNTMNTENLKQTEDKKMFFLITFNDFVVMESTESNRCELEREMRKYISGMKYYGATNFKIKLLNKNDLDNKGIYLDEIRGWQYR